jgi:DNA-binding CsgD family transcriptional regulator/PAS domain-containing protein
VAELHSAYLCSVAHLIDADAYGFYFLDEVTGLPAWVAVTGADSAFLDRYEDVGRECDPLLAHIGKTGEPVHDNVLFSGREWKQEPLHEVMAVQNLGRSLQAPVLLDNRLRGTLNFARYQGRTAFSDRDLRLLRVVTAHVTKALDRLLSDDEERNRLALAEAVLDSLGLAIVVSDREGRRVYANREAAKLSGLAGDPAASARLDEVMGAHLREIPASRGGASGVLDLMVEGEKHLVVRSRCLSGGAGFLTLLGPEPERHLDEAAPLLSPREAEVLELIALGLQNKQVAERLHISVNTVKHHLRSLFSKMQVNTRAELVARVARRTSLGS